MFLLEYFLILTIKKGRSRKRHEFPQLYSKSGKFTPLAMSKGKGNIGRLPHGRLPNIGRSIFNCYGAIPEKCEAAEQTAHSRKTDRLLTNSPGTRGIVLKDGRIAYELESNSCEIIENICICFQTKNKCIPLPLPSYAKIVVGTFRRHFSAAYVSTVNTVTPAHFALATNTLVSHSAIKRFSTDKM